MAVILPILLIVIFIAIVASLYAEGMWGNAIMLVNIVTAALLATNYWEPLADWLENMNDTMTTYTYLLDFLSLWLIFVVALIVFRVLTDSICRVKVRFLNMANQIGSVIFACLVALVMVCFTTFTLHTAPLGKNFMYGAFKSEEGVVWGWAPDQWWITFARSVSWGAFRWPEVNRFDHHGDFVGRYEERRAQIEKHVEDTGKIRAR